MNKAGYFITGTDTGVGKTVVAAALALAAKERWGDVAMMKPVESGCALRNGNLVPADAVYHKRMVELSEPVEILCPVRLRRSLAPMTAAELENRRVSRADWMPAYRRLARKYKAIFVEGAGGLSVPVSEGYMFSDMAREMELPLIIVARAGLGTVNHTLLTLEHAASKGLRVAGVIYNRNRRGRLSTAEKTGPGLVRRISGAANLGLFPFIHNKSRAELLRVGRKIADVLWDDGNR